MHRKWMVWISIPCRQVNDFADFANFEWIKWITWEKRGDAGGVAQAGSNSEIHEVHRWREDSLDCPQCGFWFEDFASMHFGWCNIWSILKDFESRYRWMSMNEPWGLLLRFACTWVIMSVWNCWLLAQMKPAIAFGLLAEPRLTFSGIAECIEVVSQFSHSVFCLFALASQFGHKPCSNLPLQVVGYGQLISLY